LNGIVCLDDAQIAELFVRRYMDRARPRAELTVEHMEPETPEVFERGSDDR